MAGLSAQDLIEYPESRSTGTIQDRKDNAVEIAPPLLFSEYVLESACNHPRRITERTATERT